MERSTHGAVDLYGRPPRSYIAWIVGLGDGEGDLWGLALGDGDGEADGDGTGNVGMTVKVGIGDWGAPGSW